MEEKLRFAGGVSISCAGRPFLGSTLSQISADNMLLVARTQFIKGSHDAAMVPSVTSVLRQVAALPVREINKDLLQILLVTSRDTGRWVIPKGWPSKRLDDAVAACREARQEAGVIGRIASKPIGSYQYCKKEKDGSHLIEVAVYLLFVEKQKKRWPEKVERQRAWFDVQSAVSKVAEPQLKAIIANLSAA